MAKRSETPAHVAVRLERALAALQRQSRAVERLNQLVDACRTFTSTLDLCQVFDSILAVATRLTGADRASLFLVDHERGELWSLIAQGLEHKEIRLPIGQGLAGWVAKNGLTVNLPDAHADARFDPRFDEIFSYRTRSLLVVPVRASDGRMVGVLELLNKRGGPFTTGDVESIDGLSVHAGIALENARLHRNTVARQRVEQELALARAIHRALLPAEARIEGFDVAARLESCSRVGGDYYDFIPVERSSCLFVIADVEGRGTRAALAASTARTAVHALASRVRAIEDVAEGLNDSLLDSAQSGRCTSVFLGLLDLEGHTLHYVNAGHPPPVVLGRSGVSRLEDGGGVMGVFPRSSYRRGSRRLVPGEVVLAYTDGITESTGLGGREYGVDRLLAVAGARSGQSAREVVDAVYSDVEAHASCNGGLDADDRLLLAIRPPD